MEETIVYNRLVYRDQSHLRQQIEDLSVMGKISLCLLALSYAVLGDTEKARSKMQHGMADECNYCLETHMLLALRSRRYSEAKGLAMRLIERKAKAAFARYFLAKDAVAHRQFKDALEYFQGLIEDYPDHVGILLDMAETQVYLKRYSEAIRLVKSVQPTLSRHIVRKYLYLAFIPLTLPKYRLALIGGTILTFIASGGNGYVWAAISAAIVVGLLIVTIARESLIFSRLLYTEAVITIIWFLCQWIRSWPIK